MPKTDEDALRELLRRATDDLRAPSAVTDGIVTRHYRRLRNTRILSITTTIVAAAAVRLRWSSPASGRPRPATHRTRPRCPRSS